MTEYSKILALLDAASTGKLSDVITKELCNTSSIDMCDVTGKTALWIAIEQGNGTAVEELLKAGANVNKTYNSRQTPLMLAVQKGHAEYIPAMLEAGAEINSLDSYSMSALMIACQKGFFDCLQLLVTAGADLHYRDIRGKTALAIALEGNSCECFKFLIEAGAEIRLYNSQGASLLTVAVSKNCVKCVCSLIQAGYGVDEADKTWKTPLVVAIEKDTMIVPVLIQNGANVNLNIRGKTPVMFAAKLGRINCLQPLVQAGAYLNQADRYGHTALMMAADEGHKECVECLVNGGARQDLQDAEGRTALMLAAFKGHYACLEALQIGEKLRDMQCRFEKTAMIYAVEGINEDFMLDLNRSVTAITLTENANRGNLLSHHDQSDNASKCLQILLEAGANPNICDINGKSPLIHAARCDKSAKLYQQLIAAGADINVVDVLNNMTTLGHAACYGNLEYVRKLVDAGTSVNTASSNGITPLIYLAKKPGISGLCGTVSYLLSHGAEVNAQDSTGMTPLMWAAKSSAGSNVMSLLVSHGAKIDMTDKLKFCALHHTLDNSEDPMTNARFLLDQGANPNLINANGDSSISLAIRIKNNSLLELFLKKNSELSISYKDFQYLVLAGQKKMLQLLVSNGTLPFEIVQSSNGLFDRQSVLMSALYEGSLSMAKFFLAIGYLSNLDVIKRVPSTGYVFRPSVVRRNPQVASFMENVHSQPWPLVKLCFVAVSSIMGTHPTRKDNVKRSGLPVRIQRMLLFQEPISRLCVTHWDCITFHFNPNDYENLPKPRPLIYYWPFGQNLTSCDCNECSQNGFRFV